MSWVTYTWGELRAMGLLQGRFLSTGETRTPHDYANEIIALAERIKAERAAITLDYACNAALADGGQRSE